MSLLQIVGMRMPLSSVNGELYVISKYDDFLGVGNELRTYAVALHLRSPSAMDLFLRLN